MTSPIALLGIFTDVVILLGLVAAVARPRLSQLARLLIAMVASACAWLQTAVFVALRAPRPTTIFGGAVIVVGVVVITVTVHIWTQGGGAERDPGQQGGHGGGGSRGRRPDAPHHGGGGSDPSWWPEFERQLAFYVAAHAEEEIDELARP